MSKRYLKKLVDEGKVESWDDPRMPTIAGLRRRGYTPEAIRTFCDEIGISKANSTVDAELLEHYVRDDLKARTESRNVIFNPIKVIITNYPDGQTELMKMENNREVPELGEREVPFSRELWIDGEDFMEVPARKYFRLFPGNEVRLKGAYFITAQDFTKNPDGSIKEILCTYDPETKSGSGFEGRKVKGTIHWVDAKTAVPVTVREYGKLMIDEEDGSQTFNEQSIAVSQCYAEPTIEAAAPGERFQFFRHGYYIADEKQSGPGASGAKVFNLIVGLKSSWKKEDK
jgi:glutaminyl-tRNA synthetase